MSFKSFLPAAFSLIMVIVLMVDVFLSLQQREFNPAVVRLIAEDILLIAAAAYAARLIQEKEALIKERQTLQGIIAAKDEVIALWKGVDQARQAITRSGVEANVGSYCLIWRMTGAYPEQVEFTLLNRIRSGEHILPQQMGSWVCNFPLTTYDERMLRKVLAKTLASDTLALEFCRQIPFLTVEASHTSG